MEILISIPTIKLKNPFGRNSHLHTSLTVDVTCREQRMMNIMETDGPGLPLLSHHPQGCNLPNNTLRVVSCRWLKVYLAKPIGTAQSPL